MGLGPNTRSVARPLTPSGYSGGRAVELSQPPPPELQALLEALDRAEGAEARQRAWDALVAYQRQHEVRAQPKNAELPER